MMLFAFDVMEFVNSMPGWAKLAAFVAIAVIVYVNFLQGDEGSTSTSLNDLASKAKNLVSSGNQSNQNVSSVHQQNVVDTVRDWQKLRDDVAKTGNQDALNAVDGMFCQLNTNRGNVLLKDDTNAKQ